MISLLTNSIQEYAWGSRSAIADLQGRPTPTKAPEAELWMGAHPKAPSQIVIGEGVSVSLGSWLAEDPAARLGEQTYKRFGERLPFLFKVLAAERALSIQSHPNLTQAREGFARENAAGIPLDARHRNYRDDNHKPELICALSRFEALRGFRPYRDIAALFRQLGLRTLGALQAPFLEQPGEDTLRLFYTGMLQLSKSAQRGVVEEALLRLHEGALGASLTALILRLHGDYPGDASILSPLFLNTLTLEPGEAMYLPAGELHAYLYGTGIELMANSDNVLRGGLTPKHIDVEELLTVLRFTPTEVERLRPVPRNKTEAVYLSPAPEFQLSTIQVREGTLHRVTDNAQLSIVLCVEEERGTGLELLELSPSGDWVTAAVLGRGDVALISAETAGWELRGSGRLFRATVPKDGQS